MKIFILLLNLLITSTVWGRSYVIFSMTQDLPMGVENEVIRKNYYVNIGKEEGVDKNTILDVFRVISIQNPYDNKKRVNYKVKIGELVVLHSSDQASIAMVKQYNNESSLPIIELSQFMIGDHVSVSVN